MTAESSQPLHTAAREFSSRLDDLTPMRTFVREMCQTEGVEPLPVRWHYQLELAVNEAASNVMRHGLNGADDQPIGMEAEVYPDRIVLRILHRGAAFDRSGVAPPAFDGSRAGGFGVYIIEQAVDYVQYSCDSEGLNTVYLMKKFGSPADFDKDD
ncbi:MAG TPA: ATP-binding protein [Pirellulales bacterium]